jgi:hypothetical protein
MNIVLEAIIVFFITIFILVTVIIIKKKVIDKSKSNIPGILPTAKCNPECRNGYCKNGKCECNNFWSGIDCGTAICDPPCAHGGVCSNPNVCKCPIEWSGSKCETSTCPPYFLGPTCNVSGFMPSNIMEIENQPYPPGGSIIKLKYFPERSWTEYGFTKSARIFTAKDDISIEIKNITNISSNAQSTTCLYAIVDHTTTSSNSNSMEMLDISYEPVWGTYYNNRVGKSTGVKAIAINDSVKFKINNGLVTLLVNNEAIVVYSGLNPEKQYRFAILTLDLIEGTISAKIE